MLAQRVLSACDALRPNAFTTEEKLCWLQNLDAALCSEAARVVTLTMEPTPYTPETALLIDEDFCDVYVKYLLSQIDFANGEIGRYNASAALFNAAYTRYLDHLTRTHAAQAQQSGVRI